MQLDKRTELKRLITKFELIAHQKVNISWSYFAHVVLRKCPCNQSDEAFHTSCDSVNYFFPVYTFICLFVENCLYWISIFLILPSSPGKTFETRPSFQLPITRFESWIITTSPTLTLRFSTCHFCRIRGLGK